MIQRFFTRTATYLQVRRPLFNILTTFILMQLLALNAHHAQLGVLAADSNLIAQLSKAKVTPDILDASYANQVQVYLNGKPMKPGDPIPARHFKDIEIFKTEWPISNMDAQHTLILLDLDRKLRANSSGSQSSSFYNQYTSVNIPGHEVVRGQAIVSLEPPTVPCAPSARHRILMLVFHQSQTIDLSDVVNIAASPGQSNKRENFNLNNFIQRHRLNLIAANIFSAVGETNGVCSAATSSLLQSVGQSPLQSLAWCATAMVTLLAATATANRHI